MLIHPVPLPRSTTPAEPTIPRLFDGLVDAAPALPTARASALNEFRGSITRLWHLLPTLQDWCCHHPCKARFRLAGSPLPGGSRTLRIATKGFRSQSHPPFLDLSWRKRSFILNPLSLQIIRSPRRRGRAARAGRSATGPNVLTGPTRFHIVTIHYISLACSHQKPMSISRYIVVAAVKFSWACSGLPVRR